MSKLHFVYLKVGQIQGLRKLWLWDKRTLTYVALLLHDRMKKLGHTHHTL